MDSPGSVTVSHSDSFNLLFHYFNVSLGVDADSELEQDLGDPAVPGGLRGGGGGGASPFSL